MNKKQKNRKTVKQNQRNRMVNRRYSSTVKTLSKLLFVKLKQYQGELEEIQKESVKQEMKKIANHFYSLVDKGVKKNVFHRNTASRKKSKVAKIVFCSI